MIGLLGKKIGMTQVFTEAGAQVPVTVLEVGPCYVTGLRTRDKHGYLAVQLAYGGGREKNMAKPLLGQFKKLNLAAQKWVREIRTNDVEGLAVGQQLTVDNFEVGDFVDVEGTSIGKGFQGVVKRLHYKGSLSKSHGSMFGRVPGTIGAKAGGNGCRKKVRKGKGLPGHMGSEQVTIQNLKVVKVEKDSHLLALEGSVPGTENGLVIIRTALKRGKARKWKAVSAGVTDKTATMKADSSQEPREVPPTEVSKPESSETKS